MSWLGAQSATTVTRIAGELLADIQALTVRINALGRELATLTEAHVPQLLALPGCGPLTAAKLYGETANVDRFRSAAAYAMHAGTAPIPASSGKVVRYRLARGGNRQLNAALYRIAVTQIRCPGRGQAYYQHRRACGDTSKEALRALKRRLANTVYQLLKQPALT
jgi:transposase